MLEEEAAPSGDSPPPRILNFIGYVTFLCMACFIETCFILNCVENGNLILPNVIVKPFLKIMTFDAEDETEIDAVSYKRVKISKNIDAVFCRL